MGGALENIVQGIAANALTSLLSHMGRRAHEALVGKELLAKWKLEETALQPILQEAAETLAERIDWKGPARAEEVCLFLMSPETEAILRQIYSAQLMPQKRQNALSSIRKEFIASFALYTRLKEENITSAAGELLQALVETCDRALNIAIDHGILAGHEARSAFRHRVVLDELANIRKNLAFLTGHTRPDLKPILSFEYKYRGQVANRHGYIIPPHFDAARKLAINDLYVWPSLITSPRRKTGEAEVLKLSQFLSMAYRVVLLGNPGGGKSTLAAKLCHDFADRYKDRLLGGRLVTPILVVLRDYGAEKKLRNCSILQFMETSANSNYQVDPPPTAFEYLLLSGRAIVIFDGLDELLETRYRQEISSDVESFCTLYPCVPVIVTSREVGYEQAPLDERKFDIFRLAPFDEQQVAEYVTKWFCVDTDLTPDQQKQKAKSFLEESQIVPDLRSNPLMLALMCNIYRGENYIPRNRPDVYEKCSLMLFERWDKSRGIHVPLPFEAHISPAMKYLAHWVYSEETLHGGVTENNLIEKATEYLCPQRFEDPEEAQKAARQFIEFCRGRAWVFTDAGTTREGERLYQFTHRTFLEYFTAGHLVRIHPTPRALGKMLLPKITRREWDVVAQLAFQFQHKNVEGAGDKLLLSLLERARFANSKEVWNLLSFAVRCLEFMIPSPRIARKITETFLRRWLAWGLKRSDQGDDKVEDLWGNGSTTPVEILGDLLSCASENRPTIGSTIERIAVQRINRGDERESNLALEIPGNLTFSLYRRRGRRDPQSESRDFWEAVSGRIFESCSLRIGQLSPKHFRACMVTLWRGVIGIQQLVQWHGIEGMFREQRYTMFPNVVSSAPALSLINTALAYPYFSEVSAEVSRFLQFLKEAGTIFLSTPTPWFRRRQASHDVFPHFLFEEARITGGCPIARSLDQDCLFATFVLVATLMELSQDHPRFLETAKESRLCFFDSTRLTLLARFGGAKGDAALAELKQCGFSDAEEDLVWKWAQGKINLVAK